MLHGPGAHRRIRGERPADARLAEVAERFGGVVDRRWLLHLGLSGDAIARRVRAGRLHPVLPRVYAVGHPVLGIAGRRWAALLFGGDGTRLTHVSALALRGYVENPGTVDVTPVGRRRPQPGVRVHRSSIAPGDRDVVGGFPTTTLERTLLDAAEVLTISRVARVLREADRRDELDLARLGATLAAHPGRHGRRTLAAALADHVPQLGVVRSELEDGFPLFCARFGLPAPEMNAWIAGFEVDARFPGTQVVVELDTITYHRTAHELEADDAKRTALAVAGCVVLPITARRLEREPAAVAAQLRTVLAR